MTTPLLLKCALAIVNMYAFLISRVFDLLACMYVQLSVVENVFSSILQANCQPANTQLSTTISQAVWDSIN